MYHPVRSTVFSSKPASKINLEELMQYLVVFEKDANSYGAYVPDLPGCVAIGETMEEVRGMITEAIQFHIEGLREDGVVVPLPSSTAVFIDVATA
jgi:predicted RNase H-like HicB family nuclease